MAILPATATAVPKSSRSSGGRAGQHHVAADGNAHAEVAVVAGVGSGQLLLLDPLIPIEAEDIGRSGAVSRMVVIGYPDHRHVACQRHGEAEEIHAGAVRRGQLLPLDPLGSVIPEDIGRSRAVGTSLLAEPDQRAMHGRVTAPGPLDDLRFANPASQEVLYAGWPETAQGKGGHKDGQRSGLHNSSRWARAIGVHQTCKPCFASTWLLKSLMVSRPVAGEIRCFCSSRVVFDHPLFARQKVDEPLYRARMLHILRSVIEE